MLSYDIMEHGAPLQSRVRQTPTPTGSEVVLRITHSGVCHSDVHFWKGYFDLGGGKKALLSDRGIRPPITMGHEPLGIVSSVGPNVRTVRPGDKRLVYPWLGCGKCWACALGKTTLCVTPKAIGVALPGGFATHLLVPDAKYLVTTDGVDDAFAATLACSGVTSYSAVNKLLPLALKGDWIAVVGCGGLGLLAISILRALGFEQVIACDVDDLKLQAAIAQGAARTLRTDLPQASAELAKLAEGRLAGVADFVGIPPTFQIGYMALRRGGAYVLVGLHGGDVQLPLPPVAQRGVSILGSYVGTLEDLEAVVNLARSGRLRQTPVDLRPADHVTETLRQLEESRGVGRTVLDFSSITADT